VFLRVLVPLSSKVSNMNTTPRRTSVALLAAVLLVAPLVLNPEPIAARTNGSSSSAGASIYYSIRQDRRLCPYPYCGGYWISAVNQRKTHCLYGRPAEQCYVVGINWEEIGLDGSERASLVLGVQVRESIGSLGNFAVLSPDDAWRPATGDTPRGNWFGVADNGIQCITFPCFNIDERTLNRNRMRVISGVVLDDVGATQEDLDAAWDALYNDELIVVGKNRRVRNQGPAGNGVDLVAGQFFLRVEGADIDDELFCTADTDCVNTVYHTFVNDPSECYCLACGAAMNRDTARSNQDSYQRHCANFGHTADLADPTSIGLICRPVRCAAPPETACIENQCTALPPSSLSGNSD
jgi:hypothetical protein